MAFTLVSLPIKEVEYDRRFLNPFSFFVENFCFLFVSLLQQMKCIRFSVNINCPAKYTPH